MKTQYRTLILAPALLVLFLTLKCQFSTVYAQGTAFTYQGQLDNGGVPANGLYDMAFRLYAGSSGGSPLAGPVTNTAVGVTNGLFTTAVNFGNAFSGGSNWLEVAVSTNGANAFNTLAPRQQLTPVPYAIAAENVNGTIGSQVSFSNAANQFTGTFTGAGGSLTGLNASQLTTGTVPPTALNNAWKTTGNSGTGPSTNFVGTLDNQPLEFRVDNQRGLRLEPAGSNSVNVIGGWIGNGVVPGTVGATISGGGAGNYFGLIWSNQVAANFGTVAGGTVNSIQAGAAYASIGGGWNNTIQSNAYSSAINGGENNTIQPSSYESTIDGGNENLIEPSSSSDTIGGGDYNTIEPSILNATIGGGHVNLIQSNSWYATIAGGSGNNIQTNDLYSTISGGGGNLIQTGTGSATIAGGLANMIQGGDGFAVIGGGYANLIDNSTVESTIAGGRQNTIGTNAPDAVIGGGLFNMIELYGGGSVIAGGYGNLIQPGADAVNGEFATISGGLTNSVSGYGTTVGGGVQNVAGTFYATVGGGNINNAGAEYATIGGGNGNNASGEYASVGGGGANGASGEFASVSGGGANTASSYGDTVGGGYGNTASSPDGSATVGGGYENAASGDSSTVPGGLDNIASGPFSFAAGEGAQAVNDGSFVWADDSGGAFASTANNQFAVRANGGILFAGDVLLSGGDEAYHNLSLSGGNSVGYLYASYPALGDGIHLGYNYYYDSDGAGHVINAGGSTSRLSLQYGQILLAVGGVDGPPSTNRLVANMLGVTVYGTFNNSSDRNAKQDFAPINPARILEKVGQLPISEWSYKEDPKTRHVGPMGQDFYATFNIGTDEKHIAPIDEGGVALAAIQALNQKLKDRDAEIQELNERLDKLERLMNQKSAGQIR